MKNDVLSIRQNKNLLLDFYGGLLTKKQSDVIAMHIVEDCSLTEIGKEFDISPQAVADIVKRATAQLDKYEEVIGMVQKFEQQQTSINNIEAVLTKLDKLGMMQHVSEIRASLKELSYGI